MGTWSQVVPSGLNPWKEAAENMTRVRCIHWKRLLSAFEAISANEGALSGRYPHRRNLPTIRSNLSRSWAEVKPHHAGEAYSRDAIVVMRATSCNWGGWRPWVLSMRRACMEEEQLERSSSKWLPMVRLEQITTPRTRRKPTRVAPDRMGSPKGSKLSLFRKMISSRVL